MCLYEYNMCVYIYVVRARYTAWDIRDDFNDQSSRLKFMLYIEMARRLRASGVEEVIFPVGGDWYLEVAVPLKIITRVPASTCGGIYSRRPLIVWRVKADHQAPYCLVIENISQWWITLGCCFSSQRVHCGHSARACPAISAGVSAPTSAGLGSSAPAASTTCARGIPTPSAWSSGWDREDTRTICIRSMTLNRRTQ